MALSAKTKALRRQLDKKQKKNRQWYSKRKQTISRWRKKKLSAIKRRGGSAASQRRSRNNIQSRYNRKRAAAYKRFVRVRRRLAYPQVKSARHTTDIFEAYDIQRAFSADVSMGSVDEVVSGQIPGTKPYISEEFEQYLEDEYEILPAVLNLGVSDLTSDMLEWIEVYDAEGGLTYTVNIDVPNSEEFYRVVARIARA
jgi:hypothetical protein